MGWPVMIGDWSVSMWVSWIGLVVPGGLAFFGLSLQNAMHAETSRAASVWRPRGLRHIVPWSRVRNHSGGQNVLSVFTVRVFLHDKHPRTLDPLGSSWEMMEPDKKGRSAP